MKNQNLQYSIMKSDAKDFLIPDGYEIVPIGTKEKASYLYINSNYYNNGAKNIKQWVTWISPDLIGKVIDKTWCVHIRKKRAKPVKKLSPDQYIYDYMKPEFKIPPGYELIPIGEEITKNDYFSIYKKGSVNLADWSIDRGVLMSNHIITKNSFPHIRKISVKNKQKIKQEIVPPPIVPEKLVHITLTPVQAFIYWKLLGTVDSNKSIELANKVYKSCEKETIEELKSSGVNNNALFDQLDNKLKNLDMSPHGHFIKWDGEGEEEKYLP